MVKSYLRYEGRLSFGVISSLDSNITYDSSGLHLLVPALDKLNLWNLRKSLPLKSLFLPSSSSASPSVSAVSASPSSQSTVASGYSDGSIRLWDTEKGTCETTLNGHRGAVTALRFSNTGSFLASGSKDNDVILWDVVGESGLFRLRGHQDQVTDVVFLDSGKKLVSCSKDKFVRLWDLDMQSCVQIIGGHHTEIWSMDVDHDEKFLVTGSADQELRFYQINHDAAVDSGGGNKWEVLKLFGDIPRQGKKYRVAAVRFNKQGNLLAVQEAGKTVEVYRVLDEVDAKHKAKRRVQRKKDKAKGGVEGGENGEQVGAEVFVKASDVFKLLHVLHAKNKITSVAFCPVVQLKGSLATLAVSLNTNMLETYSIQTDQISNVGAVDLPGHRSYIRSVKISSDSTLLMSTSHNAVKIWNPSTGSCLRTIDSDFGLCSSFVMNDKYALVGTKSGKLEIIHVGSGCRVEVIEAHSESLWSISLTPDGDGFVTGGGDRCVKVWKYGMSEEPDNNAKHLTATNVRTENVGDDVLAVSVSPTGKYVAVSLSPMSVVKVFYLDSFKLAFSLYGHKLPVLCMDISSDGDLIVTGSADKNLKIWGLDFGDCHKSIFAHADSIMAVQFVRNTHYLFSAGKDRLVKYWDADKFELLLTLEGHHAEVSCLSISSRGDFLVTGSYDRSIRRWDRTEESFFIEEEREKSLEVMFESDFENSYENKYAPKEEFPEEGSVALAGKKTQETLTATDVLIDALDIAETELKRMEQHKEEKGGGRFQPNILMRGLAPGDYVLQALSNVQTNDLEQTLLSLPFSDALKLMSYLEEWVLNPDKECKDTLGFNLATMGHLKELMSLRSDVPFRDAKAKLLEIRSRQSKRVDRQQMDVKENRRKKKQKNPTEEAYAGA
ncbi:hypothetical protein QJS10_CPB18g01704 [Acorus calamus]|uniref:Uncharacterized protein n=1 Tax=Acorus calamus TaxID=4465 RepID=A0AAV9CNQ7_ACOCL|nr:hypothetical protein QJS10_CPB18g01704 [Acorus calamus]